MSRHEVWHVLVLVSTLSGVAGATILLLSSLVFDQPPPGLTRARPAVLALIGLAALVVTAEWLFVH